MAEESAPIDAARELLLPIAEELAARGEARAERCIDLSELSEAVQEHDLGDDESQTLVDLLQERGSELQR